MTQRDPAPPPRSSFDERNKLVEAHLSYAESLVRKRYGRTNSPDVLEDRTQIAFEALIQAADRWDETKGRFIRYAKHFILSACLEYLVNHRRPTRLPGSQFRNRHEHRCSTIPLEDVPEEAARPDREPPPTPEELLL